MANFSNKYINVCFSWTSLLLQLCCLLTTPLLPSTTLFPGCDGVFSKLISSICSTVGLFSYCPMFLPPSISAPFNLKTALTKPSSVRSTTSPVGRAITTAAQQMRHPRTPSVPSLTSSFHQSEFQERKLLTSSIDKGNGLYFAPSTPVDLAFPTQRSTRMSTPSLLSSMQSNYWLLKEHLSVGSSVASNLRNGHWRSWISMVSRL